MTSPLAEPISFCEEEGWRDRRSRGGMRVDEEGAGRLVSAVEEVGLRVLSSLGMSVPFARVEESAARVLSSLGIMVPLPLVEDSAGRVRESSFGITVPWVLDTVVEEPALGFVLLSSLGMIVPFVFEDDSALVVPDLVDF